MVGPYEQTSIEFINGKMKDTKLLPGQYLKKTGNLTIPEIQGLIDGKRFVSKPIKISVVNNLKKVQETQSYLAVDKEGHAVNK